MRSVRVEKAQVATTLRVRSLIVPAVLNPSRLGQGHCLRNIRSAIARDNDPDSSAQRRRSRQAMSPKMAAARRK
jgi:hypothetical protein